MELAGSASPTTATVGPDGRPGRWIRLNAPGTEARMTQEQTDTLLPWMADLVVDAQGSGWLLLRPDAPAELGAAPPVSTPAGLGALPDTTVMAIDAQHVAVRTTASPQTLAATPGVGSVTSDALMSLSANDVSNDPMFEPAMGPAESG